MPAKVKDRTHKTKGCDTRGPTKAGRSVLICRWTDRLADCTSDTYKGYELRWDLDQTLTRGRPEGPVSMVNGVWKTCSRSSRW
jgi:hypothetical protein